MFDRKDEKKEEFEREQISKKLEKKRLEEIARLEEKIREHINTKD
jgi:hypothetical protein|tara:strand:- start:614 stop:748 length:135 start_codon:yes stop_codon:yes gene_type:complete